MAARKSSSKPGLLIDVARFLSASQDRTTGKVVFRFRDEQGRMVAVRLRPRQLRTLENGVRGLAESLDGS